MKMLNNVNILIVDDDAQMQETLKDILSEEGYKITSVGSIALAEKELRDKFYNIVLADLKLSDGTGLKLLKEIKKINNEILTIIFTGFASLESAVSALNDGAFAYIQKPVNMDEVKISIRKALHIQKLSWDNKNLLNKLKELSLKDPHTNLYNYRYLVERLTAELKRAERYSLPISVLMLDIDYFKAINDVYGHQYGDAILKEFGHHLRDFVRGNDVVVRYGGEEFIILLPDTNKEGAIIFGRRLLEATQKHIFDPKNKKVNLKISIGVSSFPEDGDDLNTPSNLIGLADKALLKVKEMGGNRLFTLKTRDKDVSGIIKKNAEDRVHILKEKLFKMEKRTINILLESICAFAKTIDTRDYYASEHIESMISLTTEIGKKLNLSNKTIENLKHAVALHDIGKVGISEDILHKKKRLNKKEYELVKQHVRIGAEIIRTIHFFNSLVPIILYHHERFDGLGYPSGLKRKKIPLGARIIGIVDSYQALVSDRSYRKAYNKKEAIEIIKQSSGTQFDPEIVEVFLEIMQSKKSKILYEK